MLNRRLDVAPDHELLIYWEICGDMNRAAAAGNDAEHDRLCREMEGIYRHTTSAALRLRCRSTLSTAIFREHYRR